MKGQCLCGAVSIQADEQAQVHVCHCGLCRRWGGGPALSIPCGANVTFEGEGNISRYASSAWAERGFCKSCGTHLFVLVKSTGDYYMPAGLFDGNPSLTMMSQIFIDKKPPYYSFSNETENLTEQQFFEKYA